MSEYKRLKHLALAQPVQEWRSEEGEPSMMNGERMYYVIGPGGVSCWEHGAHDRVSASYIAAASPAVVLGLIADNERLQGCEDVLRQLSSHVGAGGYNAPEVDPETFARKIMDGINILNDPLAQLVIKKGEQIDQLRAEVAGLKTGYEAYERVNAELKAESERLERNRDMWKGQVERQAEELTMLRKRIDDMSPFKGAPFTGPDTKCLACGGYHYGMGGLPCPNMRITAQADLPETRSGQIGAALGQGGRGGQSTSKTSQSADPEGSKGGGQ
ncbi:hypothetical protein [Pseudomonas iridis]|uniref:hypothetical protein n=1 Tax=Pseudomonas iridis TaxID=2710587 RepID=UPI001B3343B4|nr:hypothetical protein [Pseudomonas iridis]MBP5969443.1 hypothetical protein [Pseudomonas iridis]